MVRTTGLRCSNANPIAPLTMKIPTAKDNNPNAVRNGDYRFSMPQKIPSYLLAIAVGDLVFKPISARSGVWTEPSMLDAATAEFADTVLFMARNRYINGETVRLDGSVRLRAK